MSQSRRHFLKSAALTTAAASLSPALITSANTSAPAHFEARRGGPVQLGAGEVDGIGRSAVHRHRVGKAILYVRSHNVNLHVREPAQRRLGGRVEQRVGLEIGTFQGLARIRRCRTRLLKERTGNVGRPR